MQIIRLCFYGGIAGEQRGGVMFAAFIPQVKAHASVAFRFCVQKLSG